MALTDVLGGAAGYLDRSLGGLGGLAGQKDTAWDSFASGLDRLAGGGQSGSSLPSLPGGGGWDTGMPALAGGGGWGSGMPSLPGGLGWGSGMPALAGGGDTSSMMAQAQQSGLAAQRMHTPKEASPLQGQGNSTGAPGSNTGWGGASGWLASQRSDSPLIPVADELAAYAVSKGVDPGAIFGMLRKESQFGADGAMGPRQNNPGNIMADGADPANGKIILRSYGSMLEGAKAMVDLLAGYNKWFPDVAKHFGRTTLTLEDMMGIYYVGPEAYKRYGLQANDAGGFGPGGNGTVQEYIDKHVRPTMQSYNNRPGAVAPATGGGRAPVNAQGTAFPVQGYRGQVELHWGEDQGAADIFAAFGTPVAAMRGGVVTNAGWSDIGGWNVTIQGEDGLTYYYAHLQDRPATQVGQKITSGTIFGAVGDTGNAKGTGAHLHLGIGYGIHSGSGPQGGSGVNFNATEYLRRVLGLPIAGGSGGGQR
jgi:hypothetical protein